MGNVCQGTDGAQHQLALVFARHTRKEFGRRFRERLPFWGFCRNIPKAFIAMNLGRRLKRRQDQRHIRAAGHGNVQPGQFNKAQSVPGGRFNSDIAKDRRQPKQVNVRCRGGIENGHRIINARIGINDQFRRVSHRGPSQIKKGAARPLLEQSVLQRVQVLNRKCITSPS